MDKLCYVGDMLMLSVDRDADVAVASRLRKGYNLGSLCLCLLFEAVVREHPLIVRYWQKIMKTSKDDYENCDRLTERSANVCTKSPGSPASATSEQTDSDTVVDDMSHTVSHL